MGAVTKDELTSALDALQGLIAKRVRHEQTRDQLTGLGNDLALTAALDECVRDGGPFWCAFIEVDRFKSLNTKFGYASADAVLEQIARTMDTLRASFIGETHAFRAHGDEFFFVGRSAGDDEIGKSLDFVRQAIGDIKITADGSAGGVMKCTVSIGWLTSGSLPPKAVLTERAVRDAVERAVTEAKRKRDTVVRFTPEMKQEDWASMRADCSECDCRFTLDVMRAQLKADVLHCPNCGTLTPRPEVPPSIIEATRPELI